MKCIYLLSCLCFCISLLSCNRISPIPEETPRSRINLMLIDAKGNDCADKLEIGSSGAVLSRHTLTVSYNGGETIRGKTLYAATEQTTSRRSLLLETQDEVWDVCSEANSGSVLFAIDLPTLFPDHPTVEVYWEWRAEDVDRGRAIVEYKNVTVNGKPAEINKFDQLIYTIPE